MFIDKVQAVENKFIDLEQRISDPSVIARQDEWQKLTKEHASLAPIIETFRKYKDVSATIADDKEIIADGSDAELTAMAKEELSELTKEQEALEEELHVLMLPKDPNDDKNVIMEIRGGAGGQHVNKTSSAVRMTHIPSGIVVECQDERSQLENRAKAVRVLKARLLAQAEEEANAEVTEARRSQVGTGDRSERVRTYNYPQGRVTDHRINLTLYKLENIMNGDIDEFIQALAEARRAELMKEAEESND